VSGTILWDVDTQIDFVEPGGKLYFPGAEEARPAMARLVEAARSAGVVHVASCDQHELSDPEISQQPDFDTTWPPHCLLGTRGAEKIPRARAAGDPAPPARGTA
jgi:nicotinamidase/pyrazinamidase